MSHRFFRRRPGGRYARRARARARRIEKRLAAVQRERARRSQAPLRRSEPGSRGRTRIWHVCLFVGSLAVGTLFASSTVHGALHWWKGSAVTTDAIAVIGGTRLTGAEIARATGLSRTDAITDLSSEEIAEQLRRNPWIRSARAAILPTGTVIVEVEEREPIALLRERGSRGARYVDRDGIPFAAAEPGVAGAAGSQLPVFYSRSHREAGRSDAILKQALELERTVAALDATIARPYELVLPEPDSQEGWSLRESTGVEVILGSGSTAELSQRVRQLEQLRASEIGELSHAAKIDLRFAGQAVLRGERASR